MIKPGKISCIYCYCGGWATGSLKKWKIRSTFSTIDALATIQLICLG